MSRFFLLPRVAFLYFKTRGIEIYHGYIVSYGLTLKFSLPIKLEYVTLISRTSSPEGI